jgi:hypothetical protein
VHIAASFTLLACLVTFSMSFARAEGNWLTLVGDPHDPGADYIQLDPAVLTRENDTRTLPMRVSGAQARTSQDGTVYRSLTGMAAIDCKERTARIVGASFYAEADFRGTPFKTSEAGPEINPVALRGLDADRAKQVMRAACDTVRRSN